MGISLAGEEFPVRQTVVKSRILAPTPEGLACLVLTGFLFLLATNLMAGWLFFLVAFLVALLLVGAVTAVGGVRHLRVEVGQVPPAVEGGVVALPVVVQSSRTLRFARLAAVVGGQQGETFLPVVERGTRRQSTLRLAAPARGVYSLGELRLISHGLIGMFRAERRLPAQAEVVVRPRYQVLDDVPVGVSGNGGAEVPQHRRGYELFGIREYLPGDPARHIHWRSSARHRRLLVKEFEEPSAPVLALVVDAERGQPPADLDAAARAAASIAWTALQRDWQVTLFWCGADGPVTTRGNWEQLWDALARLRADGPPVSEVLGRLTAHLRETVPVVVSGRPGPLRLPVVLVAPAGSATAWEYDRDGAVRCAAS